MEVYAIKLKNMGQDANGMTKFIWATESQKKILERMRNNPDERYKFVEIGNFTFSPMDIAYMEKKKGESYDFPTYVVDRYKLDNDNVRGLI